MALTQVSPGLLDSNAQYYSFKNRIINGAMMIDQRNAGASQTVSSGSIVYTLDRWLVYTGGSSVTSQRTGSAGSYALQITGNTGNTGIQVLQRIEANNIADTASQQVTLSFTISSSTLSIVGAFYNTPTATDNFSSLSSTGTISGSIPVTSTPTRQSVTFSMPSTATNGFQFFFQTGAFTSGTLVITGVQLEKGSTATSFDYRPYGTELSLCQRYYQSCLRSGTNYVLGAGGRGSGGGAPNSIDAIISLPVQMRTAPTIAVPTVTNGYFAYNTSAGTTLTNSGSGVSASPTMICIRFDGFTSPYTWSYIESRVDGAGYTVTSEL